MRGERERGTGLGTSDVGLDERRERGALDWGHKTGEGMRGGFGMGFLGLFNDGSLELVEL